MDENEKVEIGIYKEIKSKDIANKLGIAESTVRKYSQLLDKHGYTFRRNETGARIFTDSDQVALLEMLKCKEDLGLSPSAAADIVASRRSKKQGGNDESVSPIQSVQAAQEKRNSDERLVKFLKEFQSEMVSAVSAEIRSIQEQTITKEQAEDLIKFKDEILEELVESRVEKKMMQKEIEMLKEELEKEKSKKTRFWGIFG